MNEPIEKPAFQFRYVPNNRRGVEVKKYPPGCGGRTSPLYDFGPFDDDCRILTQTMEGRRGQGLNANTLRESGLAELGICSFGTRMCSAMSGNSLEVQARCPALNVDGVKGALRARARSYLR